MNNELYHYGVKRQKWGIRRYQNPDGSLTPEGREHYGGSMSEDVIKLKRYAKKESDYRLKSRKKASKAAKNKKKAHALMVLTNYRIGQNGIWAHRQVKNEVKADKLAYKSEKYRDKGSKYYRKILSTYAGMPADTFKKSDLTYLNKYSSKVMY